MSTSEQRVGQVAEQPVAAVNGFGFSATKPLDHRDKLAPGKTLSCYARLYFMSEEDTALFAWVWKP